MMEAKDWVIILIVIAVIICAIYPRTDPTGAERVLADNGYTEIVITGHKYFACGEEDAYSTGFEAISPVGKKVSGAVCAGWWKNSTIRFD